MPDNTSIQQDKELRTCFACKNQRKLNEHDLCDGCRNEVRSVSDTWLVQEFSKWYSDDEVAEAIEQIWIALLSERSELLGARDKELERKARETALEDAQKAIADFNYKNPIARQCWYAVDALRPHKYVAASSHREEES